MNIGLTAVFISYPGGFVCGNSALMGTESDIVKELDGKIGSVKRKKTLRVKDSFIHGVIPDRGCEVRCLTKLVTGNVFVYSGYIDYVADQGFTGVVLTSKANTEGVGELVEEIKSLPG